MRLLIIKLGATGDVVRTTPLLRRLGGTITWLTASRNAVLLQGVHKDLECLPWEKRRLAFAADYDLVINLEDDAECSAFIQQLTKAKTVPSPWPSPQGEGTNTRAFGAYPDATGAVRYTKDSSAWFDLSLISNFGRQQ